MRTFLEHLTVEALETRLADLEAKGRDISARIDSGERSEVVTSAMRKGNWVLVTALQHNLNFLRYAWSQTKRELNSRATA